MTSQATDIYDYLNRAQQQAWQQSQIDKLFPSEEERTAQLARRIEDQAHDSADGAAAAASEAEEALVDLITEARDLRKKITTGVVSPDNARHALANLRQRHREIAAHVPPIKLAYERAVKTIEDPTARVTELMSKFPSLRH
jgi:hypothetical protein